MSMQIDTSLGRMAWGPVEASHGNVDPMFETSAYLGFYAKEKLRGDALVDEYGVPLFGTGSFDVEYPSLYLHKEAMKRMPEGSVARKAKALYDRFCEATGVDNWQKRKYPVNRGYFELGSIEYEHMSEALSAGDADALEMLCRHDFILVEQALLKYQEFLAVAQAVRDGFGRLAALHTDPALWPEGCSALDFLALEDGIVRGYREAFEFYANVKPAVRVHAMVRDVRMKDDGMDDAEHRAFTFQEVQEALARAKRHPKDAHISDESYAVTMNAAPECCPACHKKPLHGEGLGAWSLTSSDPDFGYGQAYVTEPMVLCMECAHKWMRHVRSGMGRPRIKYDGWMGALFGHNLGVSDDDPEWNEKQKEQAVELRAYAEEYLSKNKQERPERYGSMSFNRRLYEIRDTVNMDGIFADAGDGPGPLPKPEGLFSELDFSGCHNILDAVCLLNSAARCQIYAIKPMRDVWPAEQVQDLYPPSGTGPSFGFTPVWLEGYYYLAKQYALAHRDWVLDDLQACVANHRLMQDYDRMFRYLCSAFPGGPTDGTYLDGIKDMYLDVPEACWYGVEVHDDKHTWTVCWSVFKAAAALGADIFGKKNGKG